MDYLERKTYSHSHADITNRLKACAGQIISQALVIEHVPQVARDVMANPVVHEFVSAMFRDVVVDCLVAHLEDEELEGSREKVFEEVRNTTRSKYGIRLRLVQSAIHRMNSGRPYDVLNELERRVTPEMYNAFIAVVRQYA